MSNQAYLQGVAGALSQMNVDPQIKVASYNELEKVAIKGMLASAKSGLGRAYEGARSGVQSAAESVGMAGAGLSKAERDALRTMPISPAEAIRNLAKKNMPGDPAAIGNLRAEALARLASENAGRNILIGAGGLSAAGLGYGALGGMGDSDEAEAVAQALAADEASAERQRNLALALGGTALAGGLGYGAYKALS